MKPRATKSRGKEMMTTHAWHDVPLGARIEDHFAAVIEIPKGSKVKYELDKDTGLLRVDRILHSAVHYPAHYGLLPQTYCLDGDPLDVLVLGQEPVTPLCILRARAIGVMTMTDDKGRDDKIIAILDYKVLENKVVNVEDLRGRPHAEETVRKAARLYREKIKR